MIIVPKNVAELSPYKPGQSVDEIRAKYGISDIIKLASNENPLGTSPRALEQLKHSVGLLNIYPDGGVRLREAIAERMGKHQSNIICHSGSDALIHLILRTFVNPATDELLTCKGTFIGFTVAARLSGAGLHEVPLQDYRFNVDGILNALTPKTKIIYIANANNPTGSYINNDDYLRLMNNVPASVLVIMDEAYFEYSNDLVKDYPDSALREYPNVVTLRTFSKAYGLAGLRVGYSVSSKEISEPMLRAKLPFEPHTLAQEAALAALEDNDFLQRTIKTNTQSIHTIVAGLLEMGITVPTTAGNFVMIDCATAGNAALLHEELLKTGIIVRPLAGFGLPHCLRVSTGLPEHTLRFLSSLRLIIERLSPLHDALVQS